MRDAVKRLLSNVWVTMQVLGFIFAPAVILPTLMMPTVLTEWWMWLLTGFCGYCVWLAGTD